MSIINWVCGILAFALVAVFLGKYAVSINSIPLWVIIVGVLALAFYDLLRSAREGKDDTAGNRGRRGD